MLTINAQARIGPYEFNYVRELDISSSYENLTDTCNIVVPRKVVFEGQTIANGESLFKPGDKVTVTASCNGSSNLLFSGYVARIKPHSMLTFYCEDEMWLLKQKSFTISEKSATLKSTLSAICPTPYEAIDANLGRMRFTDRTAAFILKELRDSYGLYSFYRQGTLYSGLAIVPALQRRTRMVFGENIITPDDLWFKNKDDIRLMVKAISIKPDNTKEEVSFGDEDGEVRTIHLYNVAKSDLQARAQSEIDRLKRDGWVGTIKTLGQPVIRHGDIVRMIDPLNQDRNGSYLIKSVETTIHPDTGYLQNLHIGNQLI